MTIFQMAIQSECHKDVRQHQKKYCAHRCSLREILSCLWHKDARHTESRRSNRSEKSEFRTIIKMMANCTGNHFAESRFDVHGRTKTPHIFRKADCVA